MARLLTTLSLTLLTVLSGCSTAGLAPSVPLRRLPILPEALTRTTPGLRPAGYYILTADQWRQLDSTPCRFDPRSARAARLYRRGFSTAEIIQACRDVKRYGRGDQRHLEQLAVYRRAGLPLSSFGKYLGSSLSMTDHYNERFDGAQGLATAGWVLNGLAATALLGIAGIWISYRVYMNSCPSDSDTGCDHDGERGFGSGIFTLILTGVSALLLAPGIPLTVVGHLRKHRRLREQLLDEAHVDDLDSFRLRHLGPSKRPRVRAAVAPLITRGGGGLTFRLQW